MSDSALAQIEAKVLMPIRLRGIEKITKVFMRQAKRVFYDQASGAFSDQGEEWVLDTEGVALKEVRAALLRPRHRSRGAGFLTAVCAGVGD